MTKSQDAFRTIGELSNELRIKPHILRYWEDQFAALKPLKRAGARRHYRPADVEMIKTINRLLNEEGYTIKGARKFLAAQRKQPGPVAERPAGQTIEAAAAHLVVDNSAADKNAVDNSAADNGRIIAELKMIRNRLSTALEAA